MTSTATRTVDEGDDRWPGPVPRGERRRRRRERRLVIAAGIVVLSSLVCLVVLVLGHLHQGRMGPSGGMKHTGSTEVHVTDRAA